MTFSVGVAIPKPQRVALQGRSIQCVLWSCLSPFCHFPFRRSIIPSRKKKRKSPIIKISSRGLYRTNTAPAPVQARVNRILLFWACCRFWRTSLQIAYHGLFKDGPAAQGPPGSSINDARPCFQPPARLQPPVGKMTKQERKNYLQFRSHREKEMPRGRMEPGFPPPSSCLHSHPSQHSLQTWVFVNPVAFAPVSVAKVSDHMFVGDLVELLPKSYRISFKFTSFLFGGRGHFPSVDDPFLSGLYNTTWK